MTYSVEVLLGWSYVVGEPPAPDAGPWRYRWEAQEYADELNAKKNADAEIAGDRK